MITGYFRKVKDWCRDNKSDLFVATVIFLTGLGGFGLGRLSVLWPQKEPIKIIDNGVATSTESGRVLPSAEKAIGNTASVVSSIKGKYVASKSGTAYHFPWCPGALRIKEENKIWFETKEEAEARGFKPAGNCEGL